MRLAFHYLERKAESEGGGRVQLITLLRNSTDERMLSHSKDVGVESLFRSNAIATFRVDEISTKHTLIQLLRT